MVFAVFLKTEPKGLYQGIPLTTYVHDNLHTHMTNSVDTINTVANIECSEYSLYSINMVE